MRREGTRLFAPGVGDDTRSLAVLLAWLRAMDAADVRTRADLLFVADVGEEGPGDLRGMRHLFQKGPYKDRISAFITVDSPDMEHIATGGVGSKRYRVTFKGPGGHSYGAFGLVNPMFAMADAIARLGRITVPAQPEDHLQRLASPAAARRSTRSPTASGRTSTCDRNHRPNWLGWRRPSSI